MVIQVTCPRCGTVQLPREAVILQSDGSAYAFECCGCGQRTIRAANPKVTLMLRDAGVSERDRIVEELLTWDDLIDFHFALDAELEALLK